MIVLDQRRGSHDIAVAVATAQHATLRAGSQDGGVVEWLGLVHGAARPPQMSPCEEYVGHEAFVLERSQLSHHAGRPLGAQQRSIRDDEASAPAPCRCPLGVAADTEATVRAQAEKPKPWRGPAQPARPDTSRGRKASAPPAPPVARPPDLSSTADGIQRHPIPASIQS